MSQQAQSPAELIRLTTLGLASAKEVCEGIAGWSSDVKVGGFINLHDCPTEVQEMVLKTHFRVSWPEEGLVMPVDEDAEGYEEAVKAFRKAAKKAAKAAKKRGTPNVAQPFSKISYGAGSEFVKLGYCQLHSSLTLGGVKIAVHFWSCPSVVHGWGEEHHPYPHLAKFKIDSDEQLALFV